MAIVSIGINLSFLNAADHLEASPIILEEIMSKNNSSSHSKNFDNPNRFLTLT